MCDFPSTVHSEDTVKVFHGTDQPLSLCGYHASRLTPAVYKVIANHGLAA
jgi:hypothetical protein